MIRGRGKGRGKGKGEGYGSFQPLGYLIITASVEWGAFLVCTPSNHVYWPIEKNNRCIRGRFWTLILLRRCLIHRAPDLIALVRFLRCSPFGNMVGKESRPKYFRPMDGARRTLKRDKPYSANVYCERHTAYGVFFLIFVFWGAICLTKLGVHTWCRGAYGRKRFIPQKGGIFVKTQFPTQYRKFAYFPRRKQLIGQKSMGTRYKAICCS